VISWLQHVVDALVDDHEVDAAACGWLLLDGSCCVWQLSVWQLSVWQLSGVW
jgi:hypothetical protein